MSDSRSYNAVAVFTGDYKFSVVAFFTYGTCVALIQVVTIGTRRRITPWRVKTSGSGTIE